MLFTNRLGLTILFSILTWFCATLFFYFFGKFVLVSIHSSTFIPMLLILEVATAIVLFIIMIGYKKVDPSPFSVIKLGIFGTGIGLFLDTFIIYYSSNIFPKLNSEQMLSFTIWMVLAYAIYLIIPILIEQFSKAKHDRNL